MAKVKVWNKNVHDHVETFKGTKITIPAGQYVEMDFEEAIEFKGQWTPLPPEDCPEKEKAKYFKMIVVEWPKEPVVKDPGLICHADGSTAATPEQLAALVARFSHLQVKDDALDKATAPKEDPRISAMQAEIDELKALVAAQVKPGRGRPPKFRAAAE